MMKLSSFLGFARLLAAAAIVSGCGGGGGDSGTPPFDNGDGTGTGTTTTASDLTLTLDAYSIDNTGSQTVVATATAVDANRNAVSGIAVTFKVDNEATVVTSGTTTDENGVLTGTVSIGADKTDRIVTVTATSGSLTQTQAFSIVGAQLVATPVPASVAAGANAEVQYRLLDANSVALQNVDIVVTGPSGAQTEATTDVNGRYDYAYKAPSAGGPFQISATAGGVTTVSDLVVTTGIDAIPPAVGTVSSASLSSSPNVVAVNSDSSANQSDIRALFVGSGNAPIKNVRVRFDLDGDPNNVGGTIAAGSSIVYTDDSGAALTSYRPATRPSPTDGVTIRACWSATDFAAGTCPNEVTTQLTVVSEALSVSIGTNNLLEEGVDQLTYIKRFIVQVVDSSGQAKAGVTITPAIDLPFYLKGQYIASDDGWSQQPVEPFGGCLNEDLNRNGVADTYSNGLVEDANHSAELTPGRPALEPRRADVAISFENGSTTDDSGQVVLRIEYPKNIASWVTYNVVVSASGIGGTEGRANFSGVLGVLASDLDDPDVSPPFQFSPYGVDIGEPQSFTTPDGSVVQLCTNPN